jgi:hypothetical protein
VTHLGREFVVHISGTQGAASYLVVAATAGGRRLQVVLGSHRRVLDVPAAGWTDRIAVTVTPLSATGRAGRATRARLGIRFTAPRFPARRSAPHPRHR